MVADGRHPDLDGLVDQIDAATGRASCRPALRVVGGRRRSHGPPGTRSAPGRATAWSTARCSGSTSSYRLAGAGGHRGDPAGVPRRPGRRVTSTRSTRWTGPTCTGAPDWSGPGSGVGAGTDAPFGPEDPWVAIALGGPPDHPVGPGGRARRVPGTPTGAGPLPGPIRGTPGARRVPSAWAPPPTSASSVTTWTGRWTTRRHDGWWPPSWADGGPRGLSTDTGPATARPGCGAPPSGER